MMMRMMMLMKEMTLMRTKTCPLESPVMRSPQDEKARQVKYFGLSRGSRTPVFLLTEV